MQDLTFGEQVKIILGRKGMTIKQLYGIDRGKNREENVETEPDTASWQR